MDSPDLPFNDSYCFIAERRAELCAKFDVFESLITDFPTTLGKKTSKAERDIEGLRGSSLIYGEVDFLSLGEAFDVVKHKYGGLQEPGGVFYDLGSVMCTQGTGKGVLSAALLHSFDVCRGIEILSGLHTVSLQLKDVYTSQFPAARAQHPDLFPSSPEIDFRHGSFLDLDWSDATFLFANSTCFDPELILAIAERPFPVGHFAITLTKALPSYKWEELTSFRRPMSWGEATVYIQRRTVE